MRLQNLVHVATLASFALADNIPFDRILWGEKGPSGNYLRPRTDIDRPTLRQTADSACSNGPYTRSCWSDGFSVATDFDNKWPITGKTTVYSLTITNGTCNPDGNGDRPCQLFNNRYPGPVIAADWGDKVVVNLKNAMTGNGTGIHFHGIRQLGTCPQDGVPGITECPLAPGDSKTYTWTATQFGTTWYHSHWTNQYGDGAFGAIVINGPASANYDIDLGAFPFNDLYYATAYQVGTQAHNNLQAGKAPPTANNIIVNGTNKNAAGKGSYGKTVLQKDKKYRLRLINTSADNSIRVSLDNHPFQVITADLVPIKPYVTNWVLLATDQRYDVIFTANQTAGNYWFRANAAADCASSNAFYGRGIFTYDSVAIAGPTSTVFSAPGSTHLDFSGCKDESPLVPWVVNTVDPDAFVKQVSNLQVDVTAEQVTTNSQNIVVWGVNLTAINVDWDMPTLQYVKDGNTSYPKNLNLIEMPTQNMWSYWIIQETTGTRVPIPHPIHLHGHDFYVLGAGTGQFDINNTPSSLKFNNPIRRDTAILPGNGWLTLAFPLDNPGAWLMHCHIAWHVSDGLAVQFLESKSTIPTGDAAWSTTCKNWNKYALNPAWPKVDSGLKRGIDFVAS